MLYQILWSKIGLKFSEAVPHAKSISTLFLPSFFLLALQEMATDRLQKLEPLSTLGIHTTSILPDGSRSWTGSWGIALSFSKSKHFVKRRIQSLCLISGVGPKKTENSGTIFVETLLSPPNSISPHTYFCLFGTFCLIDIYQKCKLFILILINNV